VTRVPRYLRQALEVAVGVLQVFEIWHANK